MNSYFPSLRPMAAAPSARPPSFSIAPKVEPVLGKKGMGRFGALLAAGVFACAVGASHHVVAPEVAPRTAFAKAIARTTESGKTEHWGAAQIPVVLDGSLSDMDPKAQDAVVAAFGTWMSSGAQVSQVSVDRSSERGQVAHDGVNRILFGPITIAGHEKDVAVTISYADSDTGVIQEADTIFNSMYAFEVLGSKEGDEDEKECGKKYDVQNVATHEFGHFFGLGEDVSDTTTTMYIRSAPCQTHKRELTQSDEQAMAALYVGGPSGGAPSPAASSCAASPAAPSETTGAMFLFAAVLAFMLRRGSDTRTSRAASARNRLS